MATQDQLDDDDLAYNQAFTEDPAAEDESMLPEEVADEPIEEAVEAADPEEAEAIVDEAVTDDEPVAAPPVDALVLDVEQDEGEEPTDPKDIQRAKSWEGRLRAREAELAAREKALQDREKSIVAEEVAEVDDDGESVEERVGEVAAAVRAGDLSAEEALSVFSQDFGSDFSGNLTTVIRALARESAAEVADERLAPITERLGSSDNAVAALIADITDDRQRRHFEVISDAHPDFIEMAEGQMMDAYLNSLNQADRQSADTVIASGSARDIIKLLDAVKKHAQPAEDPAADTAADAAEGVRSSGLRLPEPPKIAEGYEEAWLEF